MKTTIELAREAGIKNDCDGIWCDADQLKAFAELVRADERERIKEENQRCYAARGNT